MGCRLCWMGAEKRMSFRRRKFNNSIPTGEQLETDKDGVERVVGGLWQFEMYQLIVHWHFTHTKWAPLPINSEHTCPQATAHNARVRQVGRLGTTARLIWQTAKNKGSLKIPVSSRSWGISQKTFCIREQSTAAAPCVVSSKIFYVQYNKPNIRLRDKTLNSEICPNSSGHNTTRWPGGVEVWLLWALLRRTPVWAIFSIRVFLFFFCQFIFENFHQTSADFLNLNQKPTYWWRVFLALILHSPIV